MRIGWKAHRKGSCPAREWIRRLILHASRLRETLSPIRFGGDSPAEGGSMKAWGRRWSSGESRGLGKGADCLTPGRETAKAGAEGAGSPPANNIEKGLKPPKKV